jgi:hypothetical protein
MREYLPDALVTSPSHEAQWPRLNHYILYSIRWNFKNFARKLNLFISCTLNKTQSQFRRNKFGLK